LLDHFERGKLLMSAVEIFVIDEADRMPTWVSFPISSASPKLIPFTRQTLSLLGTMPAGNSETGRSLLQNPERVEVSLPASTATTVTPAFRRDPWQGLRERATLRDLIRARLT